MKKFLGLVAMMLCLVSCAPAQVAVKLLWYRTPLARIYNETYRVQLSTDSSFAVNLVDQAAIADTSFITAYVVTPQTKYYWRVNATNAYGTGPWSEIWWFTTAPLPPVAPLLILPIKGAVNVKY